MGCNCTKILDLPTCIDELIIGEIPLLSQDVFVFIKNTSIEYTIRLTGVSDSDGIVTVDFTTLPDNFFGSNFNYELWVTSTSEQPNKKQVITIEDVSDTCLNMQFFRVENNSLESVYYSTVTAELA